MIPSKMRTLFQGAHEKVRIFAEPRRSMREADRWLRLTTVVGCRYVQSEGTIY
jgi:hypothetical protein